MTWLARKSANSRFAALFLSMTFAVGCSYDPSEEPIAKDGKFQVDGEESEASSTKALENRLDERPIVLKKMSRLSSEPQSLAFTSRASEEGVIVCESLDELREEVRCRLESLDGDLVTVSMSQWKLKMLKESDPQAELQELGGEWQVSIYGEGKWSLEVLREDGSRVAKVQKGQTICHSSLVEHVGLDGANRCLDASSPVSSGLKGFSHLRLVNLQAESRQAVLESAGSEALGKRGDHVALSVYTSGLEVPAAVGSYGLPILDSTGQEVMRVCMSAEDLRSPGWLGAQLRLSGTQSLKVGRPQAATDDLCRQQSQKGMMIWYEAHIF